ncbi:MAG TPA: CorA family divalent cation transporter [Candidatus Paceibacterota bacterium]|nr:CorA family divalent cation transporter [Candidatus Paceibacterota bacterium]HRZ34569.1 CorA family divalent cation transporter [Candidatus Paceibacterota bacterium]
MIYEYKHKNITWVDLENPTTEEIKNIADRFDIDPMVAGELLIPTLRSRVDYYKDYIYLILLFPISSASSIENSNEKVQEVDFIIGEKFIITTRYSAVDALLEFSKVFEVHSILNKGNMSNHAGYIFYYMLQFLYKSLLNRLANIRDLLSDIENKIFSGNEKTMVKEISKIDRFLLNYSECTSLHKDVLESFSVVGEKFFKDDFSYYLHSIIGEYLKVKNEMTGIKEYLAELRNTNDSLLSTKQNEIMKVLTVINFIFLPLALIAALFNMNTETLPIVGAPNDFYIILGVMAVLTILMFLYFKRKKWL